MEVKNKDENIVLTLPEGYIYSEFSELKENVFQFECNSLKTESDIKQWVKRLSELSYVEWRVSNTYPNMHIKGRTCFFRIAYRCQHGQTWYSPVHKRRTKGTRCIASLRVKRGERSTYDTDVVTTITINKDHNHAIGSTALSLKFRDVGNETKEKLRELFANGHSPSSAHHILQSDALMNESYRVAADRNRTADLRFCYKLFYKEFQKEYGKMSEDDESNYAKLKEKLDEWCESSGGSASFEQYENDIIIIIITPLMKRVHSKIIQSGEIMFLDARGHCNGTNHKIYLLSTHSVAGELPLGYIITSSSEQTVFERALLQYCLLDNDGPHFFNRGSSVGPKNIITDNDLSERNALKNIWPNANLLLCTINVLRAVWNWILQTKHNIGDTTDQRTLFFGFRNIMMANTTRDVIKYYDSLQKSEIGKKYPEFLNYIDLTWWPVKETWCICYRNRLLIRSTNNYVDYAVRALKDIISKPILKRTKAYNIVHLVDLIVSRFDKYYCQFLTDFSNGCFSISQLRKFLPDAKGIDLDQFVHVENQTYLIKNKPVDYIVDMAIGFCTCYIGVTGSLCKHQSAIILHYEEESCILPNESNTEILLFIASGKEASEGLLDELDDPLIQSSSDDQSIANLEVPNILLQKSDLILPSAVVTPQEENISDFNDAYVYMKSVFDDILERLKNNPTNELIEASQNFCQNYTTLCRSDHALQSALSIFGKDGGVKKLASATGMGVQPTAISRRKMKVQGKRRFTSGRRLKSLIRDENMQNYLKS